MSLDDKVFRYDFSEEHKDRPKNPVSAIFWGYRKLTDWVKPLVDKVVDPLAFFLASNAALSTGIYYSNKYLIFPQLDKALQSGQFHGFTEYVKSHDAAEAVIKIAAYGTVYGVANAKVIWPLTKKLIKKTTEPTWLNHMKTWAIVGGALLLYNYGGIKQDYKRWSNEIKSAHSFKEYVNVVTNETNLRVIDNYLSGEHLRKLATDLRQIGDEFTESKTPPAETTPKGTEDKGDTNTVPNVTKNNGKNPTESIELELRRIESLKTSLANNDPIAIQARALPREMIRSPEELIYLTRVIYFESGFDLKAGNERVRIRHGAEAVASVIYNRYLFDNQEGMEVFSNREKPSMTDIAFRHGRKGFTRADGSSGSYVLWQFTAIRDNPDYFYPVNKEGYGLCKGNRLAIATGEMDEVRAQICYEELVKVLSRSPQEHIIRDITGKALFYQNITASDSHNKNWKDRGLEITREINSHTFYKYVNGSDWTQKMNLKNT